MNKRIKDKEEEEKHLERDKKTQRRQDIKQARDKIEKSAGRVVCLAAKVDFAFAELVRPWTLQRWHCRPWHKAAGWRVCSFSRSRDDGMSKSQEYWLLSDKSLWPHPKDDLRVLRALLDGLGSLERQLKAMQPHPPLRVADIDWDVAKLAWQRRDDSRFRPQVESVLGRCAFEKWQQLVHPPALDDRDDSSSDAPEPARVSTDARRKQLETQAKEAVDQSFAAARSVGDSEERAARHALVACYLYFGILAAWELSDDHERPEVLATALVQAIDDSGAITSAVGLLARALPFQLGCETGLFCSCPIGLGEAANGLVELLTANEAQGKFECLLQPCSERADLSDLAELIYEERGATLDYAWFLARVAAPVGEVFTEALVNRTAWDTGALELTPWASPIEFIEWAGKEAAQAITALDKSVYASEVRPYVESYTRMARGLGGPSLTVEDGEIVLLYPFGLPGVAMAPHDLVRELLASDNDGRSPTTKALLRSGLLGCAIAASELTVSNTFAVFGAGDDGHESTFGARLEFTGHRLMLQTTAHITMEDIDIEVRLGSYGNHCVRVAFTTEHRRVHCAVATQGSDSPSPCSLVDDPWTAHDIDQWVRRAGLEVGDETVWLERPTDDHAEPVIYTQVVELAEAIVKDLQTALAYGNENGAPTFEVNDLHSNAHVMILVRHASQQLPDGSLSPLRDGEDLPKLKLLGSQALLISQRGLAATLEDWVRYDVNEQENLLKGIGHPGDLLAVNGDVTVLCALESPNWVTLETQHMVEFAVSAIGPLAAWSVWLRRTATRSAKTLSEAMDTNDVESMLEESAWIAENLGFVRSLIDRLRSAQLMRSHRDRDLLARFMKACGTDALQQSLEASIAATLAQRTYGVAQAERIIEMRKKRAERSVEWLLGFIGLGGLFSLFAWLSNEWLWRGPRHRWYDLVFLLIVALVLVFFRSGWFESLPKFAKRVVAGVLGFIGLSSLAVLFVWGDDQWGLRSGWFDVAFVIIAAALFAGIWWLTRPHKPRTRHRKSLR